MLNKTLNVPSKMVADRVQSTAVVLWAIREHGHAMVDILDGQYCPYLEDGEVMPFEIQLRLFEKALIHRRDDLVEAERELRAQKARENKARRRRDAAVGAANGDVVALRRLYRGAYSDDQLVDVGFARQTPQGPEELYEQAVQLVDGMDDSRLQLSGRFEDFELNARPLVRQLKTSSRTLQQASSDLRREERISETKLFVKDQALKTHNHAFLWIARTVESLLRLAGLEALAARVRPSARRPGVTVAVSTGAEAEGETPDAAGSEPDAATPDETSPEVTSPTAPAVESETAPAVESEA